MILQRDDLVEPVRRADLQVRGVGLESQVRQQPLEAHARPANCADQIAADGVGDARERDELVQRLVPLQIVQRQTQGLLNKSADLQAPLARVDGWRDGIDVDAIVLSRAACTRAACPARAGPPRPRWARDVWRTTALDAGWDDLSAGVGPGRSAPTIAPATVMAAVVPPSRTRNCRRSDPLGGGFL